MKAEFSMSQLLFDVTMNFTYSFTDDPINEQLLGNITWTIPDSSQPAHWVHSEDTCNETNKSIKKIFVNNKLFFR